MTKYLCVIPECYVETSMAKALLDASVNHQYGCGSVTNKMTDRNNRLSDSFAIGLIDDDKKKSSYSRESILLAEVPIVNSEGHVMEAGFSLLKHDESKHYFIVTKPAMEKMILSAAKQYNIKMSDFQLPDEFEKLKAITKNIQTGEDYRFIHLFKVLSDIEGSPLNKVKKAIKYMVNNPYNIDDNLLIQILTE